MIEEISLKHHVNCGIFAKGREEPSPSTNDTCCSLLVFLFICDVSPTVRTLPFGRIVAVKQFKVLVNY